MRSEKSRGGTHHLDDRPTAQSKSVMQQKLAAGSPPQLAVEAVAVDYPRSGERVASREYAFRVSTEASGGVEVSIDGGAWLPCRRASGFWWRDWSGYAAGPHSVFARVNHHMHGRTLSARRDFVVVLA